MFFLFNPIFFFLILAVIGVITQVLFRLRIRLMKKRNSKSEDKWAGTDKKGDMIEVEYTVHDEEDKN